MPSLRTVVKLSLLAVVVFLAGKNRDNTSFHVSAVYEPDPFTMEPPTMVEQMKNKVRHHAPMLARSLFQPVEPPLPVVPTAIRFQSHLSIGSKFTMSQSFLCDGQLFEYCKTIHQAIIKARAAASELYSRDDDASSTSVDARSS